MFRCRRSELEGDVKRLSVGTKGSKGERLFVVFRGGSMQLEQSRDVQTQGLAACVPGEWGHFCLLQ